MALSLPEPSSRAGAAGLAAFLADPVRALVSLDFDGTLAPVVERPEDAAPAAGAIASVAALSAVVGTVVILTGRAAPDVVARAGLVDAPGLERLVVLGHYGLQRWEGRTGQVVGPSPAPGLQAVALALPGLLASAGASEARIEDKQHSMAVHARGLESPGQVLDGLRRPLAALAAAHGLEVVPGRLVLELRPPGTDKGRALEALIRTTHPSAVLVVGDDLGDLPAFEAVRRARDQGTPGLMVCSGSVEAPDVAAAADLVVDGPTGVVRLLTALVAVLGHQPRPAPS